MFGLESLLAAHAVGLGIIASLIAIVGALFAIWRWGRSAIVALFRWAMSISDEARSGARRLRHPLLIQSGDRRQRYWAAEQRGQDTTYVVRIGLHITNLESRDILVSKARLHYRGRWIRMQREGDISLVDPSEGSNIQGVVRSGHMTYGQGSWRFQKSLGHNHDRLPLA
jgi:hypothetical protein